MDNTKESIRHLSLCAGYGGIDLGLRRVLPECRTVAYVEIEAFAIQNLVHKIEAERLDPAPVYTDVKSFPFKEFRGCVDILSGGFPCQPFSQAGSQRSTEDPRHIFPYILEGIRECRPTVVFLENVEGIISSKTRDGESVLQYVLKSLEEVGYSATAGVFSASEIGAPHQRKRVFILGYAKHDGSHGREISRGNGETVRNTQEGKDTTFQSTGASQLADSTDIRCGGRSNRNGAIGSGIQVEETQVGSMVRSQASGCSGNSGELADSHSSGGRQDRWQSELRAEGIEQSSCNQGGARERQAPEGQEGQQKAVGNPNVQRLEGELQARKPDEKRREEPTGCTASDGRVQSDNMADTSGKGLESTQKKIREGKRANMGQLPNAIMIVGHQDQTNPNTTGKNPGSWATPNAGDGKAGMNMGPKGVGRQQKSLGQDVSKSIGGFNPRMKLNPNWVEQLMGLPVGWTQIETEQTD